MRRMTLTFRLVLSGIAIMLVPAVCIGLLSTVKSSNAMRDLFTKEALVGARSNAEQIQMALSQELNEVRSIAMSKAAVDAADKIDQEGEGKAGAEIGALQGYLSRLKETVGQNYEAIVLFSRQGIVCADSHGGKMAGVNVKDREYFKDALQGKTTLGQIVISKTSGLPVVPLAVPLIAEDNHVIGVLAIILKIDYILDKVSGINQGRAGYVWVVDRDGTVIAHPDKSLILKHNVHNTPGMEKLVGSALGGTAGVESYIFNGEEKLAGFAPVPLTGWSVIIAQSVRDLMAPIRTLQWQILFTGSVLLVVVATITFFSARRISGPIGEVARGLSAAADQVVAASAHISDASQHLAEGSSEQAAGIEEASSSLEEMTSMTRQNAENAGHAHAIMQEARKMVEEAGRAMEHLSVSMAGISKASDDTRKIIKTIDEIAFQTNLLALNAAVEAARAGEAGAGFAIVADEVRNLAMRAAEAARNTTHLIDDTGRKIREGSEVASGANSSFSQVATYAMKMGELVGEIAAASKEQSVGISQISTAIAEMDKVVQQNAANAEESASASEELSAQAEQMKSFVGDLTSLIGSAKEARVELARPSERRPGGASVGLQSAPARGRNNSPGAVQRRNGGSALLSGPNREFHPNQVIPFHDEDFRDL